MTHPNEEPERKQHARKRADFRCFSIVYEEHYDTSGSVTQRDIIEVEDEDWSGVYHVIDNVLSTLSATWDELIDAAPTTATLS